MLVGESPLWHNDTLYWVDIDGFAVHSLHPASGKHRKWPMASEPSALAISSNGGLIVALRAGMMHLNTDSGALTAIAAAPYDTATTRFNDGKVDATGRFWVGTIYEPRDKPAADMYVLDKGELRLAWPANVMNSNGLAFSPDNTLLYHADTAGHKVTRYAFDAARATISDAQVVHQFSSDKTAPDYGGRPDGAAVDAEGNYWVALFEGGRVVKLSPSGVILQEIALPVRCPTMVTFGGDDLKTLYITTAGKRPAEELARLPLSGKVLQVKVDVAGNPASQYQEA
ncbi:SMP-30/gluconolactonase/LRE family protein [Duganella ginsengisoli]|uniref:SMP-30/gluconolactonase/LRE family protein n=2 Tax=Pseudoduganella ginsengisoli TaxID=1462440 RepID=A0A6L6Q7G1_9BURK|nr:SMP-30/gluconolactonase/LRE family protein [Pseudoduganella ginsengisoli]